MVKYLGSKRTLVPLITRAVTALGARSVADVFAGTTRVGQALRESGTEVWSNDLASYSEVFGRAYVQAGPETDRVAVRDALAQLGALDGTPGYVTATFAQNARYFTPENAGRIDAIRDAIDDLRLGEVERALVLASLIEAADRVDSTVGVQMAYLKAYAARARNPLTLREPRTLVGPVGSVTRLDANVLAPQLDAVDVAYIDPPYNQHSYFSNYHVWETLVRWDAPEHYGIACKRIDCRTTKSAYNRRAESATVLNDLLARITARAVVVSLSDEGFHDAEAIAGLLAERGHVAAVTVPRDRYVGARIGIFSPQGKRVGAVGRTRNVEHLLICGPDRARVDAAARAACEGEPGAAHELAA